MPWRATWSQVLAGAVASREEPKLEQGCGATVWRTHTEQVLPGGLDSVEKTHAGEAKNLQNVMKDCMLKYFPKLNVFCP